MAGILPPRRARLSTGKRRRPRPRRPRAAAVALLQAGPSARFPHAVAVVRDWLLEQADGLFAEAWPERASIAPGGDARRALRTAFGLGA